MLDEALDGLYDHLGSYRHQLVVDVAGSVRVTDEQVLPKDDSTGVDVLVDHESGRSGPGLSVDDGPVDRSCAPVLRQKGGVEVEGSQFRHCPDLFRKHPEGNHYKDVGLVGFQLFEEVRVLELQRLEDRDALLHGEFLDCAFVDLLSASAWLVSHGDDSGHIVSVLQKCLERCHGEFRSSHVNYSCLLEHCYNFALCFPPPVLDGVEIGHVCVVDCLPGQEKAYGKKHS